MKLKLEISDVVAAYQALLGVAGKTSIDMSWAIDDIKEVLEKHTKRYEDEQRKLLEEYGDKNALGNYSIKREKMTPFNEKIEELGKTEIEIEFEPLDYDIVISQNVQFPATSGKALRKFIVKQKVEKPEKPNGKEPKRKIQPHKAPTPVVAEEVSA